MRFDSSISLMLPGEFEERKQLLEVFFIAKLNNAAPPIQKEIIPSFPGFDKTKAALEKALHCEAKLKRGGR